MKYAILCVALRLLRCYGFASFRSVVRSAVSALPRKGFVGNVLSVNVSVCGIALDEVASWTYILAHEH